MRGASASVPGRRGIGCHSWSTVLSTQPIDPEFTGYPLRELAAAALQRAPELGAEHADFRAERIRGQHIGLSDGHLETLVDADDLGLAVRVVLDGTWGFAAAVDLTTPRAVRAAEEAMDVARVAAAMNTERIELAGEPGYGDVSWVSAYEVDPLSVAVADKLALLGDWSARLLASPRHRPRGRLADCRSGSASSTPTGSPPPPSSGSGVHPVLTAVAVQPSGAVRDHAHAGPASGPGL